MFARDGTVPSFSPEMLGLQTSCLSAWALLSTLLAPAQLFDTVGRRVALMSGLFASPDLELRIAAGETMALLLENAYDYDEVRSFIQQFPPGLWIRIDLIRIRI
jgi:hypothetical protein